MTTILGHSAAELTANDVRDFMIAALNPFYLWYYMVLCHATPMKHADHHFYPRQVVSGHAFLGACWARDECCQSWSTPPVAAGDAGSTFTMP